MSRQQREEIMYGKILKILFAFTIVTQGAVASEKTKYWELSGDFTIHMKSGESKTCDDPKFQIYYLQAETLFLTPEQGDFCTFLSGPPWMVNNLTAISGSTIKDGVISMDRNGKAKEIGKVRDNGFRIETDLYYNGKEVKLYKIHMILDVTQEGDTLVYGYTQTDETKEAQDPNNSYELNLTFRPRKNAPQTFHSSDEVIELPGRRTLAWSHLAMTPDGKFITSTIRKTKLESQIFVYDVQNRKIEEIPLLEKGRAYDSQITDDGKLVYYKVETENNYDSAIYVWDRITGQQKILVRGNLYNPKLSGNGRFLTYSGIRSNRPTPSDAEALDLSTGKTFSLSDYETEGGRKGACRERTLSYSGSVMCPYSDGRVEGILQTKYALMDLNQPGQVKFHFDYLKYIPWKSGEEFPFIAGTPTVSPDQKYLFFAVRLKNERTVYRYSFEKDSVEVLAKTTVGQYGFAHGINSNFTFFWYDSVPSSGERGLVIRSLNNPEDKKFVPMRAHNESIDLSDDGKVLTYYDLATEKMYLRKF